MEAGDPNQEKRKSKRIQRPFTARVQLRTPSLFPSWDIVTVQNLSADGMLFSYDKQIPPGTVLDFKINFPMTNQPIDGTGKVIRAESMGQGPYYSVATYFTHITQTERELINESADEFYSG